MLKDFLLSLLPLFIIAGLWMMFRRRRNQLAESPVASACTKESAMSVFEQEIRQVFDFALLNSGYGNMQPWIRLRRAV